MNESARIESATSGFRGEVLMKYLRSSGNDASRSIPEKIHKQQIRQIATLLLFAIALTAIDVSAQDQTPDSQTPAPSAASQGGTVTIPAGTSIALVLTHPIESRYIHHGDDIYAQVTSPVTSANQMVIPPGTFVQGTVDKLGRQGDRGELRLQSMSITFPDGYVAPISGPVTIETNQGYAVKDPGNRRMATAVVLPLAGAGVGALIGHSVGQADSSTNTPFPPGCVGPPPFCTTVSTPTFGTKTKDAIIGAGIGSAVGAVASVTLLFSSHHFFIDAGAPVEITLQQPVSLDRKEVDAAVQRSADHPVAAQPVMPRPQPPPVPNVPMSSDTCWTPGTPGTPPTVIPGAPGPDGVPGPPTIIPGTPPTPGTAYPCP
jgi:hypothetical protein